jgi:hypothetical protein
MTGPRILALDIECRDHGQKGNAQGYGRFWVETEAGRKKWLAHRVVFEQFYGYRPPVVMHACDNTRCIEPAHLEPGDWDKNNKDRATKGRSTPHLHAKRTLTDDQVRGIRNDFPRTGVMATARKYNRDANVVYQITSGRTYKDVI